MTAHMKLTLISVDVAKDKLDYYNTVTEEYGTIPNDARSIGNWLNALNKTMKISKVVLEPTGGYEDKLLHQLHNKTIQAFFIHPNKLHAFKKERGEKAKTDRIDTFYLAEYGRVNEDRLTPVK